MPTLFKDKYKEFGFEDFLSDNYFIRSVVHPTPERERFWEMQVESGTIKSDEYNKARFYIESLKVKEELLSDNEIADLRNRLIAITSSSHLKQRRNRSYAFITVLAACFTGLMVFLFAGNNNEEVNPLELFNTEELLAAGESVLVLAEEEIVTIEGVESKISHDEKGISINTDSGVENKTLDSRSANRFNHLVIPKGKRSYLLLEDGSKLWVNAGSHVAYPVKFEQDKREIYVEGEVFLDVAKDEKRPFIVRSADLEVRVLGTSFNVNTPKGEGKQEVVVVTGTVSVSSNHTRNISLYPGQMLTLQNERTYLKDVDVDDYILWIQGIYKYSNESLGKILDKLASYYGEQIELDNEAFTFKCTGKLDLKEDLSAVLSGIAFSVPVGYRFEDGKHFVFKK